jgi:multidrug efflux pump subunit AcrA (membrane-fusion protein)
MAGLTALSGIVQYQAQQDAADARAKAYEAQARAAEQNARIENRKQEQVADNAARETEQLRQRQRLIAAQNRARYGAAGLSGTTGSPLDLLSAGYDAYTLDKETALSNQRNKNFDLRVRENNFLTYAANNRAAAENTRSVARTQGLMTILGTSAAIIGNIGGGSSGGGSGSASASGSGMSTGYSVPTSVSSNIGHTTANWNLGGGYSFAGRTLGNNSYNLYKPNYFSYR